MGMSPKFGSMWWVQVAVGYGTLWSGMLGYRPLGFVLEEPCGGFAAGFIFFLPYQAWTDQLKFATGGESTHRTSRQRFWRDCSTSPTLPVVE